jgi:hypothetical protein
MAGFPILNYQYTGLGSIYFWDFILFHRFLGIQDLLSVEYISKIKRRVTFNRPFRGVRIAMKAVGDVIPTLSTDKRHIVWLDYDSCIRASHVEDIESCGSTLTAGSILLITLDVQAPSGDKPADWRQHFMTEAAAYLGSRQTVADFVESELPRINIEIVANAIQSSLVGRDVDFIPLVNFSYADGHEMMTVGGMIGTEPDRRQIRASSLRDAVYFRPSLTLKPYRIRIPSLTRKERLTLDAGMPCDRHWRPEDVPLPRRDVKTYSEIYRFFPAYAELLL